MDIKSDGVAIEGNGCPQNGDIPAGDNGPYPRHGRRDLLVYCGSINCNHSATMNADHLSDDTVIRALGPKMVCTKCGVRDDRRRCAAGLATAGQ